MPYELCGYSEIRTATSINCHVAYVQVKACAAVTNSTTKLLVLFFHLLLLFSFYFLQPSCVPLGYFTFDIVKIKFNA